eukprot:2266966-Karenia_brevis.AAC.1
MEARESPTWSQDGPKTTQLGAKMAPRPLNLVAILSTVCLHARVNVCSLYNNGNSNCHSGMKHHHWG